MRDPSTNTKRFVTQRGRLNTPPRCVRSSQGKTVNKKRKKSNTGRSQTSGASSKRRKQVIVRGLVSYVNQMGIEAPVVLGISISYPTSAQVRPWLVHSLKLGADLVLWMDSFRFILAATLPSWTQHKRFLNVWARHFWNMLSANSANKDKVLVSVYNTAYQHVSYQHNNTLIEIFHRHSRRFTHL